MSSGTESSTPVLPNPPPSQSQAELGEAEFREALSLSEGIRRLMKMAGVASNNRNLKTEDAAYKRSLDIGEAIHGTAPATKPSSDEMDVMAARDVIVNHHYPQATPPTTPAVTPPPASTLADKAKKAALIAAIAGGGAAAPLIYQYFNQKPTPPVVAPVDPTLPDFNLLPPDAAPGDTK